MYIVLFVYTATSKLIHLDQFGEQLGRFPYISPFAPWIALGVPLVELAIVGLFLVPKLRMKALYASVSLMALFTIYIVTVLKFSDSIPCSCGGVISSMGWTAHILFNVAFIVLGLLGILLMGRQQRYLPDNGLT